MSQNNNLESDATITKHRSFAVIFGFLLVLAMIVFAVVRMGAPMVGR